MQKYFYKLGHIPSLGVWEFFELQGQAEVSNTRDQIFDLQKKPQSARQENPLSGSGLHFDKDFDSKLNTKKVGFETKEAEFNDHFLLSDRYLDVNKTGSLVFSGINICSYPISRESGNKDFWQTKLDFDLAKTFSEVPKKLGVATTKDFKIKEIVDLFKKLGVKKVNALKPGKFPNFGNFRNTPNWVIFYKLKGQVYFAKILDYYNQGFWSELDLNLPKNDMRRGIINLKLARSLNNLTNKKIIWDPFCGVGRNAISSLDRKDRFLLSDIDLEGIKDAKINLDLAREKYFQNSVSIDFETKDATKVEQFNFLTRVNPQDLAIVTEGTLGTNFGSFPGFQTINLEWAKVFSLWKKIITKAEKIGISEIIFCLPFYQYQNKKIMPEKSQTMSLIAGTNYCFVSFGSRLGVAYIRESSITGHYILKLTKLES